MTPLLMLAKFGDESIEMFKKLIDRGAEINAKDAQDNSVLHYIAMSQARQIFTYIKDRLEYDFKFDDRNKNGDTPLSIADKSGNKHFKEFFHKHSGGIV